MGAWKNDVKNKRCKVCALSLVPLRFVVPRSYPYLGALCVVMHRDKLSGRHVAKISRSQSAFD